MPKSLSIYERSNGRFIPLGGKSRRYVDTYNPNGPTLSRRQVDNILHETRGYEEKRVKANKAANPKLSQQRPARGRKSTLPKKTKKKNKRKTSSKKRSPKTTKMVGKTGTYYKRTYSAQKILEVKSFLEYHLKRGGNRWYAIGHFRGKVAGMEFDRTVMTATALDSKIGIEKDVNYMAQMAQTMNGPDNAYELQAITIYVMYSKRG